MFWSALEARDLHQLIGWSRIPVYKNVVHNVLQVTFLEQKKVRKTMSYCCRWIGSILLLAHKGKGST
jgi:hypothetical protein